ncbi:hypothetical protein COOONC_22550 [Cooperia oncophora]
MLSILRDATSLTNPVLVSWEKPPSQRTEKTAEWGVHGVAVVLELLRLLASLKDFSKLHKDQYWRSLKDPRLISFLAFALAYGDHEMVHNALVIYTHCSQLQAFPSRWLGDLIASCSQSRQSQSDSVVSPNTSSDTRSRSCEPMDTAAAVPAVVVSPRRSSKENERVLDERRERELELLLSAKDQALAQSEKLRIQFRGAGSNNNDMARVRSLVSDCEALREKNEAVAKELEATRQLLQEKTATMEAELARVVQERDDLASEISQEREVVVSANKLADDLKKKLEIASVALVERQSELATLNQEKANLQGLLNKASADLAALHETHVMEVKRLNSDISLRNDTIDKLSREAEAMQATMAAKEQECERHTKELESLRSHGQKTQADLERMKRLRDEMKRLAEGFE